MIDPVRIESFVAPPRIKINRSVVERTNDQRVIIEDAWRRLCDHNPKYFNGNMLAFEGFDTQSGVIQAGVEQYKHHAVRNSIDLGIAILAVTGVLCVQDGDHTVYMIGKRSPSTHRYGNLWEFGPCGGVDVPPQTYTLDYEAITQELGRESLEEAGIDLTRSITSPLALVHDDVVGSVDIALRVALPEIPKIQTSWEYVDCQWIDMDELNRWIASNPGSFIPTTIAIAQLLTNNSDYD